MVFGWVTGNKENGDGIDFVLNLVWWLKFGIEWESRDHMMHCYIYNGIWMTGSKYNGDWIDFDHMMHCYIFYDIWMTDWKSLGWMLFLFLFWWRKLGIEWDFIFWQSRDHMIDGSNEMRNEWNFMHLFESCNIGNG